METNFSSGNSVAKWSSYRKSYVAFEPSLSLWKIYYCNGNSLLRICLFASISVKVLYNSIQLVLISKIPTPILVKVERFLYFIRHANSSLTFTVHKLKRIPSGLKLLSHFVIQSTNYKCVIFHNTQLLHSDLEIGFKRTYTHIIL